MAACPNEAARPFGSLLADAVTNADSATALSRHDPVRPWNAAAQPVTAVHAGRRGELAAAVAEDGQHLGHHPLAG